MANVESHIQFLNHKRYFINGFQSGCISSHKIKFLCMDLTLELDCLPFILLSTELRSIMSELIYRNLELSISLPNISASELQLFIRIATEKEPNYQEVQTFCEIANILMVDTNFLEDYIKTNLPANAMKSEVFEAEEDFRTVDLCSLDDEDDTPPVVVDPGSLHDDEDELHQYYEPEVVHFPNQQDDEVLDNGKMASKKMACVSCYQDPQFATNPRRVKSLCELCRQAVCGEHVVKSCMSCHESTEGGVDLHSLDLKGGLLEKKSNCSSCMMDPKLARKPKRPRTMCSLCKLPVCGTHMVKSCVACRTSQDLYSRNSSDVEFEEDLEGLPEENHQEGVNLLEVKLNPASVQELKSLKRKLTSSH